MTVIVKYLRHVPPFMPGDRSSVSPSRAEFLRKSGAVEVISDAKPEPRKTVEFDPATSEVSELRAFISGRGESLPPNLGIEKLRARAAEILAKDQA